MIKKVKPEENIKTIEKKVKSLKAEKTHIYESFADDRMDREHYLKRKSQIQDKLDSLERRKEAIKDRTAGTDALSQEANQYMKLAKELYAASELTEGIVDAFIERVTIYDEEHIDIKFKFGDLIKRILEESEKQDTDDDEEPGQETWPDNREEASA